MSADPHDPDVDHELDDRDPIDRIEPDISEEEVEQGWEETDPEGGEAPTG